VPTPRSQLPPGAGEVQAHPRRATTAGVGLIRRACVRARAVVAQLPARGHANKAWPAGAPALLYEMWTGVGTPPPATAAPEPEPELSAARSVYSEGDYTDAWGAVLAQAERAWFTWG
jgi:hypothetical protein